MTTRVGKMVPGTISSRTRFTEHALERAEERLHLTCEEIALLLDEGKYVPLGKDGSSDRLHKLFYSEPDSFWFVAVQDERTAEVITVLPVEYHNRWRIAGDALKSARAKVLGEWSLTVSPEQLLDFSEEFKLRPGNIVFRCAATVMNELGKKRIIGLGHIQYSSRRLLQVTEDIAVHRVLHDRLMPQLLDGERLLVLIIRHGKKSKIVQLKTLL